MNGTDARSRKHPDGDIQFDSCYLDNPSPKVSKIAEFVDWVLLSSSIGLGFLALVRTLGFHA